MDRKVTSVSMTCRFEAVQTRESGPYEVYAHVDSHPPVFLVSLPLVTEDDVSKMEKAAVTAIHSALYSRLRVALSDIAWAVEVTGGDRTKQ